MLHRYDTVLIQLPKGRALTRRWLLQAYTALKDEGTLWIAGSNKAGIQSAIKDAEMLFGNGHTQAYKKGNRVAQLVKKLGEPMLAEWADAPGIAPGTWIEYSIEMFGHNFQIRSLPGVFSSDHLDTGTELLLNNLKVVPGARVLDAGCGSGIIGLVAAYMGAGWVDLVDNDLLAIASSKESLLINNVANAEVHVGDLLTPLQANHYQLIVSNPPFHTGHEVNYQVANALIKQAYDLLDRGGQLIIVANRFIPYDHLIGEVFGNITRLAETGKFQIISGLKLT